MRFCDYAVRVRYAETDQMRITHHASYPVWFEAARSELFRELGLPYAALEAENIFLPLADLYCKYLQPSVYDEIVYVRTSVSLLKMSSMRFSYQVLNENKDTVIAYGHTTHIFVDDNKKPVKVPQKVRDIVTVYELKEKSIESNEL